VGRTRRLRALGATRRRAITALAAALLALWAPTAPAAAQGCRAEVVELRGDWGQARLRVELALTPAEQARGLMFREEMARMAGMLFVYDGAREVGFWMRNTLIPLDMIFVGEDGVVTRVHEGAVPGDETVIPSQGPVRAVLEVNAGLAADLGVGPGTELRSPVMPQDAAAWPCD
jgi:uncharacterized membrane protein (UPF0127 family)